MLGDCTRRHKHPVLKRPLPNDLKKVLGDGGSAIHVSEQSIAYKSCLAFLEDIQFLGATTTMRK